MHLLPQTIAALLLLDAVLLIMGISYLMQIQKDINNLKK